MLQISNFVYCDDIFKNIEIENKILPNPYKNFPYLIIKNFFSEKLSKEIAFYINKYNQDVQKAKLKTQNSIGGIEPVLNEEYRKTNIYKLDGKFKKLYERSFFKHKPIIEKFYNIALTDSTDIQVLEYKEGFFYKKHADDSNEIVDTEGKTVGFVNVVPNRKITTVLFGTSYNENIEDDFHFNGGELIFNYLYNKEGEIIKMKPQAGDMLVFPSNPYFTHEVLKVKKGYRLTLVQWHDGVIL